MDIAFGGGTGDSDDLDLLYYAWLSLSQPMLSTIAFYYDQVDMMASTWLHGLTEEYSPNGPNNPEQFVDLVVDNASLQRRLYYTSSHDEELLRSFYMQKYDDSALLLKTWSRSVLSPFVPSLGINSGLATYRLMS